MAETIKEKDFVEIEYTGRIKDDNFVFDTTDKAIAKEHGLDGKGARFGPVVVCIGEGMLMKGLEKKIIGKLPGKYKIDIKPEEGFGKKSAGLIKLVSTSKFKSQKINPMPGLQVEIDGTVGTIKTVTGGRTMVDFNHPLASKDLIYDIEIKRILNDTKEKAENIFKMAFHIEPKTTLQNDELTVTLPREFPAEIEKILGDKVLSLVPEIKKVSFQKEENKTEPEAKKETPRKDAVKKNVTNKE
jgi:FKBP-type peptidyl-prolyl cis-trans isomerase 2